MCQRTARVQRGRSASHFSTVLPHEGCGDTERFDGPASIWPRSNVEPTPLLAGLRTCGHSIQGRIEPTGRCFPALALGQCIITAFVTAYRCGAVPDFNRSSLLRGSDGVSKPTNNGLKSTADRPLVNVERWRSRRNRRAEPGRQIPFGPPSIEPLACWRIVSRSRAASSKRSSLTACSNSDCKRASGL